MSNTVFFWSAALAAAGLIALALVYPQGLGARSPAPFGHAAPPAAAPAAPKADLRGLR